MKKHLLIGASILAFGITTTALYAQVTGTSVVDKMKAVAHSFTLATTLNPSDTGLTSDPVKGKKTGDILTAGEWNRVLELVSDGGSGGVGGGAQIVEGGIIKTSPKTISNWDLITLEGSWNGGSDAAPSGGYIYKINGQAKLSYVEASGISKDLVLSTTAQNVHNLTVKISGDSVIIDPSSTNTLSYVVWKLGGGSGGSVSSVEVVTSQDVGGAAGTSYANRWSEANCPAGKKIVSGGCSYPGTRNSFIHNAPKSDLSGWTCGGVAYNGDIGATSAEYPTRPTAYAVCGVYGSSSAATLSWTDVPLTDTASYDADNCQYRFKLTGPVGPAGYDFSNNGYYNAYYVTPGLMESVSGIFIKSSNKNTVYAIDNSNNNVSNMTAALNWRTTKIEKRCN